MFVSVYSSGWRRIVACFELISEISFLCLVKKHNKSYVCIVVEKCIFVRKKRGKSTPLSLVPVKKQHTKTWIFGNSCGRTVSEIVNSCFRYINRAFVHVLYIINGWNSCDSKALYTPWGNFLPSRSYSSVCCIWENLVNSSCTMTYSFYINIYMLLCRNSLTATCTVNSES